MTRRWPAIFTVVLAVGIVSCAKPTPQEPVKSPSTPVVTRKPALEPAVPCGQVTSISMEKLFQLHQNGEVFLLDARPSFFYSLGHIQGAISMPSGGSAEHIKMREEEIKTVLAAKKTIVLYCSNAACPDARAVAANLAEAGYSSSVLVGGYESWKDSGLPVE
ncbi:MAG: rhodanese-like domain-containing protein [Luteolibacter sp.]